MNKLSTALLIAAAAVAITFCTCNSEPEVVVHSCGHSHELTGPVMPDSAWIDSVKTVPELLEMLDNMPTGE